MTTKIKNLNQNTSDLECRPCETEEENTLIYDANNGYVLSRKDSPRPKKLDNWELMRLSEAQDCEAYDAADLEELSTSSKRRYREFYDDVKQPVDYIKEDW